MRNSFPVTAYCSMSSAVVVTQTCNALLQQTVAPSTACLRAERRHGLLPEVHVDSDVVRL